MRATTEEIGTKRQSRSSTVLLTGGTGFVGSHIAAALLRAGYRVLLLSRSSPDRNAEQRMRQAMRWHGLDTADGISVVEGDLLQPRLGISGEQYAELAGKVDEIVHCASHTSFSQKHAKEIQETNVAGTLRMLELAEEGRCVFFHYISTAYAVGRRSGLCLEMVGDGHEFHNPYEASKNEAERMVMCHCAASGMRASVYRPSIIIGDSREGKTLLFNAMYYPVKMAHYLADSMRNDFNENGGQIAGELGVTLEADGRVRLPIRLDTGEQDGGVINMVPIDFVVNAFMEILERDLEGGVYHLVNKQPGSLDALTTFTQRYFGLSGMSTCLSSAFVNAPKTLLERQFDGMTKVYHAYMSDTRRFDTARAEAILNDAGIVCPPIDYDLFRRCIDYAVSCGWIDPREAV